MSSISLPSPVVVAAAGVLAAASSVAAGESDPPDIMYVTGIVRDFMSDHPDFSVIPGSGYGHYCGNIATSLDESGKPVFVGGGFRVAREWRATLLSDALTIAKRCPVTLSDGSATAPGRRPLSASGFAF